MYVQNIVIFLPFSWLLLCYVKTQKISVLSLFFPDIFRFWQPIILELRLKTTTTHVSELLRREILNLSRNVLFFFFLTSWYLVKSRPLIHYLKHFMFRGFTPSEQNRNRNSKTHWFLPILFQPYTNFVNFLHYDFYAGNTVKPMPTVKN